MLKQILLTQMRERGPMPFEEFQAAALYDPEHGFFSRGELRSTKAGDFLTSPEVSPLFGETLARFVEKEMERIWAGGLPPSTAGSSRRPLPGTRGETTTSFHLVEVGAGSGSLLKPLLAKLSFAPEVWAIEASPMARNALNPTRIEHWIVVSGSNPPCPWRGTPPTMPWGENTDLTYSLQSTSSQVT
jgi:hypothetical protein